MSDIDISLAEMVRRMPVGWELRHTPDGWEVVRSVEILGGLAGSSTRLSEAATPDVALVLAGVLTEP